MHEQEVLDALSYSPLPASSARRVALRIITRCSNLSSFESELLVSINSGGDDAALKSALWGMIDKSVPGSAEDARLRLFACAISKNDKLDDAYAEMLYYWSERSGVDEKYVSQAIEEEMVSRL